MSDALLPYYERELDAIKRLAAEFADTHPKIAGRLRFSPHAYTTGWTTNSPN